MRCGDVFFVCLCDGLLIFPHSEETGWKLVYADVFRAPPFGRLLSVMTGSGLQLFIMVDSLSITISEAANSCWIDYLDPSVRHLGILVSSQPRSTSLLGDFDISDLWCAHSLSGPRLLRVDGPSSWLHVGSFQQDVQGGSIGCCQLDCNLTWFAGQPFPDSPLDFHHFSWSESFDSPSINLI